MTATPQNMGLLRYKAARFGFFSAITAIVCHALGWKVLQTL